MQLLFELIARIFQTKHEQQKQHTDLAANANEIFTQVQRQQPAVAEGQPPDQVKRDG